MDTERLIFTRGGARSHLFIYLLSFFISGCLQGQAIGYFSGVFDYDYKNVNRIVIKINTTIQTLIKGLLLTTHLMKIYQLVCHGQCIGGGLVLELKMNYEV